MPRSATNQLQYPHYRAGDRRHFAPIDVKGYGSGRFVARVIWDLASVNEDKGTGWESYSNVSSAIVHLARIQYQRVLPYVVLLNRPGSECADFSVIDGSLPKRQKWTGITDHIVPIAITKKSERNVNRPATTTINESDVDYILLQCTINRRRAVTWTAVSQVPTNVDLHQVLIQVHSHLFED